MTMFLSYLLLWEAYIFSSCDRQLAIYLSSAASSAHTLSSLSHKARNANPWQMNRLTSTRIRFFFCSFRTNF
ncbi:hypothetical protein C1646_238933 [Rhizophagus diaphanus]|nr:hypothetical protein C1646_238933 [Rhizophagus diaphanus] [Rhizophagus sp. MUCL 43196]